MQIRNVHRRFLAADLDAIEALLATLATREDRLWPRDRWPAMRFRDELVAGAEGGHGPVRYRLVERDSRRVAFAFLPRGLATGLRGGHAFEITPAPGGAHLSHVLEADCGAASYLLWLAVIRPLHDALLEDGLDRAERALTGAVASPARWGLHVRTLRWLLRPGAGTKSRRGTAAR